MSKPLFNVKVAMLVAGGFTQQDFTTMQRALLDVGANVRIVSSDNGIVNGWDGAGWGHNFAVDAHISKALGSDFNMLIIPGGQKSMDKLKLSAHTKRFVGHFFAANKPVVAMNEGVAALVAAEAIQGRTVNGADALADFAMENGAIWSDDCPTVDGSLVSGSCDDESRAAFVTEVVDMLIDAATAKMAQAA